MRKILIGDDHAIIRLALKLLISDHMPHEAVEEETDSYAVMEKARTGEFHLLILGAEMPGIEKSTLVEDILEAAPGTRILLFNWDAEKIYARKYLQLGVMGYISKDASETDFRKAIDSVLENKKYLSAYLIKLLTEERLSTGKNNPFGRLSPREHEIVEHLMKGESTSEISTKLNLQPSTVCTFKNRIFEKLDCKNVFEINELMQLYKSI